jgi:hypothetical protein
LTALDRTEHSIYKESIMGYQTNKFDKEGAVEAGGWQVVWSDDITETDIAEGAIAGGVSIAVGNPAPFLTWLEALIDQTSASLGSGIGQQAASIAKNTILQALQGRTAAEITQDFSDWRFKAGAITYSGENTIGNLVLTRTWGMKIYAAVMQRSPSGTASGPVVTPNVPTDPFQPLTVVPPVYSTSQIVAFVNDSNAVRKFGAPVYVKIPAIDPNVDIIVKGCDVSNYTIEDPAHSELICKMAEVAYVFGRSLRIASAKYENNTIYAISVSITEKDTI